MACVRSGRFLKDGIRGTSFSLSIRLFMLCCSPARSCPPLFSLIDREIGVRRRGPADRFGATLALVGVVGLCGLRDYEHRRALNALQSRVYEGANPVRASAYPYWWNPFRWFGVVETQNFYALTVVDSLGHEVDPDGDMRIRYKPD